MSPEYLSPGVYVEEVDKGTKPIEGAGTAMAAFVGFTEKGPANQPTFIPNWTEFVNTFGGFLKGGFLAQSVYGYFQNGGGRCYIPRIPGGEAEGEPKAVAAIVSGAQPAIETLSISALEAGAAGADITVEFSKPTGDDVSEDQFNVTVHKGTVEEVFEKVTLRKAKGVRNVVETINKESKLVKAVEKESTLALAERTPKPGAYALSLASAKALSSVKFHRMLSSATRLTGRAYPAWK